MAACIIAFFVFSVLSIFSAKYRKLAKEAFRCVFLTVTFKPCDTDLNDRIKSELVSTLLAFSPGGAKILNRHFAAFSWGFFALSVISFAYLSYGVYNFYYFGNCDGPESTGACILNDLTGDYGRFSEPADLIAPTDFDGITDGNPNADTTIVEFGCFTCPYTKQAEAAVEVLLERHGEDINYVFKPFPLPNHENSYNAAIAVLCANRQDKSWELRRRIFEKQEQCSQEGEVVIKDLAREAGLDMEEFNRCYDNMETAEELDRYIQQGKDAHIYATPTFFVNGKPLIGPQPIDEFEKVIK